MRAIHYPSFPLYLRLQAAATAITLHSGDFGKYKCRNPADVQKLPAQIPRRYNYLFSLCMSWWPPEEFKFNLSERSIRDTYSFLETPGYALCPLHGLPSRWNVYRSYHLCGPQFWASGSWCNIKENRQAVLIIVLDEGNDEQELRGRELARIDESIEIARPYVLVGPFGNSAGEIRGLVLQLQRQIPQPAPTFPFAIIHFSDSLHLSPYSHLVLLGPRYL